jgi:hypothetical protein
MSKIKKWTTKAANQVTMTIKVLPLMLTTAKYNQIVMMKKVNNFLNNRTFYFCLKKK